LSLANNVVPIGAGKMFATWHACCHPLGVRTRKSFHLCSEIGTLEIRAKLPAVLLAVRNSFESQKKIKVRKMKQKGFMSLPVATILLKRINLAATTHLYSLQAAASTNFWRCGLRRNKHECQKENKYV
jgi:hypothetical protein